MDDLIERTRRITAAAAEEGFDACAAAPIGALEAAPRFQHWLAERMHGSMEWLGRNVERRTDPRLVVPNARSVLVLRRNYYTADAATPDPTRGCISRYAWGDEYHDILGTAIRRLYARIHEICPTANGRYYVDTGPIMEKPWAELAGLGWIGKHTNLLAVGTGSWFFLAAIILDIELDHGSPARNHCGTCSACIDVCPTAAIVAPYVLDARRCIAYLTIENRGPIPREMRPAIGNRIFGCDDCQDVCPWNRFAVAASGAEVFAPRDANRAPRLRELLRLSEDEFRTRFRGSPVKRAKHVGLLRNVAVALGNSGDQAAVPDLISCLSHDAPLVRGHVAWALGRLGGAAALAALRRAADDEPDTWVREEIGVAVAAATDADAHGTVAAPC